MSTNPKDRRLHMSRQATMLFSFAILAGSFLATAALAIERTCQAHWELIRQDTGGVHVMEAFSANGACGSNVPNRCRIRARTAAQECMATHWAQRSTPPNGPWVRPGVCTSGNKVFKYNVGNLKCRIEKKIKELGWCGRRVRLMRVTGGPTDHCDSRINITIYQTDATCSKIAATCALGPDPVSAQ
jgi:hypothetical protein